jgi:hypothetical protein
VETDGAFNIENKMSQTYSYTNLIARRFSFTDTGNMHTRRANHPSLMNHVMRPVYKDVDNLEKNAVEAKRESLSKKISRRNLMTKWAGALMEDRALKC